MSDDYPRLAEIEDETDGELADILWYEAETRRLEVLLKYLKACPENASPTVMEAIYEILDGGADADEG